MGKAVLAGIFALAATTSLAQTADDPAAAGRPANLCQELLAFVKAPPAAEAAKKEPGKKGGSTGGSSSSQEVTGQSGPAHESPDPKAAAAAGGTAKDAPQKSGMSAPVPTDGESVPEKSVVSVAEAEELARANDIAGCQAAFRELRIAGVAVPPPLLALAALDLQYQSTAQPDAPAADTAPAPQPQAN